MRYKTVLAVLAVFLFAACGPQPEAKQVIDPISGPDQSAQEQAAWTGQSLANVASAQQFTIDSYQEPVFVVPFATWCSSCTRQLTALEAVDAPYVGVAIDSGDDVSAVREFVRAQDFSGTFSVARQSFVDALVAEFGPGVQNFNSAPVILVCGEESFGLESGVKTPEMLESALQRSCN